MLHLQTRKLRFCKVRAPAPVTQLVRDGVGLISDDPFQWPWALSCNQWWFSWGKIIPQKVIIILPLTLIIPEFKMHVKSQAFISTCKLYVPACLTRYLSVFPCIKFCMNTLFYTNVKLYQIVTWVFKFNTVCEFHSSYFSDVEQLGCFHFVDLTDWIIPNILVHISLHTCMRASLEALLLE